MAARVAAVSTSPSHTLVKENQGEIRLAPGLGVEGDAHAGVNVQHVFRIKKNADEPNLRQVHLIHSELHEELRTSGFCVSAGVMGENITTEGIDLLGLPVGTRLRLGEQAVIEITGLRNPCHQLNKIQEGLLNAVLDQDENGNLIRKAGIMAVILQGGAVRPGRSDSGRLSARAAPAP